MRDDLTVKDVLVFKGNSVVIPKSFRADTRLKDGVEAYLRRAR